MRVLQPVEHFDTALLTDHSNDTECAAATTCVSVSRGGGACGSRWQSREPQSVEHVDTALLTDHSLAAVVSGARGHSSAHRRQWGQWISCFHHVCRCQWRRRWCLSLGVRAVGGACASRWQSREPQSLKNLDTALLTDGSMDNDLAATIVYPCQSRQWCLWLGVRAGGGACASVSMQAVVLVQLDGSRESRTR